MNAEGQAAFAAAPTRSLALPGVDVREIEVSRVIAACRFPPSLRAEIARTAHELLERLATPARRPAFELREGPFVARLEPDGVALDDEFGEAGLGIARGLHGVRLVRTGETPVWRNDWLVARERPVALRDGDVVRVGERSLVARYEPPLAAPLVEIGPPRPAFDARRDGFVVRLALEPSGEPVVLRCDGASGRAVLDTVVGGDGSRPFDRTTLGAIETETIEWTLRRFAHDAAAALLGSTAAVADARDGVADADVWLAAAVRVGTHHGAWRLGTTAAGLRTLAGLLARRSRGRRTPRAALARVAVWTIARVPLGRVPVGDLAALEPGDTLVARGGATWRAERCAGEGIFAIAGSAGDPVPMAFELDGGTVRARVAGPRIDDRRESRMDDRHDPNAQGGADETPFAAAIDGIGVTVWVEIARRRMALGDLAALAPGDVVEMNAAVRNAVTLVVDGSAFARGELVDVEGSLGVRVVAMGGAR
jgi:type III secretion system YscQ/HrcQ family protein